MMRRAVSLVFSLLLAVLCWARPSAALLTSAEHVTGTWTFTSPLLVGTIGEAVAGQGVTIDGLTVLDGALKTTSGAGTAGTLATAVEYGGGAIHRTVLTVSGSLTITDATTAGAHGSSTLYTFPAGAIRILGATADLAALCGTTGLTATATNEIGLGTVTAGTDNAALTSTEEDVITGSASDLVASAETLAAQNLTGVGIDGTTTAGKVWLNFVFAADDASANDACAMSGTVTFYWINAGDY